jgi:hypothetical protein
MTRCPCECDCTNRTASGNRCTICGPGPCRRPPKMRTPGTWTDKDARRLRDQQERLADATRENMCGDLDCEGLRHEAALFVLKGGTTHHAYADVVQWAAQKRPVLSPGAELTSELLAAFRETFAEMALNDPAREAGLMLVEAAVARLADRLGLDLGPER